MIKEIVEKVLNEEKECKKRVRFKYNPKTFDVLKKYKTGGTYPYGGEIVAYVTPELYKELKKLGWSMKNTNVGDCVVMDNGWTLD